MEPLAKKEVGCKFCSRIIERQRERKQGNTCFDCRQKQKLEYSRKQRLAMGIKPRAKKV